MLISRRMRNLLLSFLIVSTLVLVALIVGDWIPYLRGPAPGTSEWHWPHLLRPSGRWWPSILAATFMLAVAAWWFATEKATRRQNIIAITGLISASLLLQLALVYADRSTVSAELLDRTLSNQASGFFEPAAEVENIARLLRDYPQVMPSFVSEHAQTHPPGLIVANWLTIKGFARWPALSQRIARLIWPLRCADLWLLDRPPQVAAALGFWSIWPILAAALTVIPAFGLARHLLDGRAVPLASVLAATLPSLILFAPKSVQLYAPLVLILFWTFHSGLAIRSTWRLLLASLTLSLMTFLSLGNAALYLLLLAYASMRYWLITGRTENYSDRSPTWTEFLKPLVVLSLGAASIWLLVWWLFGASPLAIAQIGLRQHYDLVTRFRRYEWWVAWNIVDLILFAGWPLLLGFLGSLALALHLWRKKHITSVDILALCLILLIILLDLSGSARGETGRIWLFFLPLLAFPTARFWNRMLPGPWPSTVIVALQLLMVLSLGLAWRPVRAVIVVAERPTLPDLSPQNDLNVVFAGEPITLHGYSLQPDQVDAGDALQLTLFWRASRPTHRPYTVFNHLVNENGELVAQQDSWPVNGRWPPTCWRSEESVVDTYKITLPVNLPAGSYKLLTGMYDASSGTRVPLAAGGEAFHLATIDIPSAP